MLKEPIIRGTVSHKEKPFFSVPVAALSSAPNGATINAKAHGTVWPAEPALPVSAGAFSLTRAGLCATPARPMTARFQPVSAPIHHRTSEKIA
jgi:hypothetical protein